MGRFCAKGMITSIKIHQISIIAGIIFTLSLSFFSSGCGNQPKAINDFIKNYNNQLKHIAKSRNLPVEYLLITDVEDFLGAKTQELCEGTIVFTSGTTNSGLIVTFTMDSDINSDIIFGVMEAVIPATGGEVKKVLTGLGIQKGTEYKIPSNYSQKYSPDKHTIYSIEYYDELIIFSVGIK